MKDFKGILSIWMAALSVFLLGACGKKEVEEKPFGPTGIPAPLRSTSKVEGGTPVKPGSNSQADIFGITPQEDIVFTDPDNPDAGIPELANLMSAPKRGPWEDSITIARQEAVREGKPMLLWFTDSSKSPMCKALSQELLDR